MSPPIDEKKQIDLEFSQEKLSIYSGVAKGDMKVARIVSPEEKKLVRKINIAFVPLLCAILFVQFLDKSTINNAGIMGLYEDTDITHNQFSWLGSVFYVGYLSVQLPNQYLLQRVPISKYLGVILIVWGACLACTALGQNFSQLAALRYLLGFFEGTTYPSIFLLVSTLYRRHEQVTFFGIMFIMNAISSVVGGAIALGIEQMDGLHGLSAWKWSMILWGVITAGLGFVYFVFLPDRAKSRWFRLTPVEEQIVEARTLDNAVVQNKDIKMSHVKEALKEPRLYCYFCISLLLNLANGGTTLFSSQIISQMGFSTDMSLVMAIPSGACTVIIILILTYLSKKHDEVGYYAFIAAFISFLGALLLAVIPSGGGKLSGLFICATSPLYVLLQTSISSNVSGYTKKIFYTSANLVAYCIGNFVGPLMLTSQEAPRYIGGLTGYMVADLMAGFLFLYVRWTYVKENKRREVLRTEGKLPPPPANREELDLTDKEDLHFVYRP